MTDSSPKNILNVSNREQFRLWLSENASTQQECWVELKRGKPKADGSFYYIDAVEEALCFGWIDSTLKNINGRTLQRFSPRKKTGVWTELNKERVRRLERLGLMTDLGRAVLPNMSVRSFKMDSDLVAQLKQARVFAKFKRFPPLYQRVKAYNIAFYKQRDRTAYERMTKKLIEQTKKGVMFGEWNDYGRLLE